MSRQNPACIYIGELMVTSTALIVTSQDLNLTCVIQCRTFIKQVPNAQLVSISNAGHCMNMDNPEEFNRILFDFIANLQYQKRLTMYK